MPAALAPTVFSLPTPIGLISPQRHSLGEKARKHLSSVVYLQLLVAVEVPIQLVMCTDSRCGSIRTKETLVRPNPGNLKVFCYI